MQQQIKYVDTEQISKTITYNVCVFYQNIRLCSTISTCSDPSIIKLFMLMIRHAQIRLAQEKTVAWFNHCLNEIKPAIMFATKSICFCSLAVYKGNF